MVLLSGEAGIGKSRLTAALLERLATEPHTRLRYFCSPQHTDSSFYPIISQMERAAGFAYDDAAHEKLDKLDALLAQTSTSMQDAALFAEMMSLANDGRYPGLELTPQQRRQKTLEALSLQLEALTRSNPVLMIFEDAHWIDPTSLEVFGRTVDRIASLRVLLIVTFRPEFEPPWIGHPHVTPLTINRLAQGDIDAMIDGVVGNKLVPASVRKDITRATPNRCRDLFCKSALSFKRSQWTDDTNTLVDFEKPGSDLATEARQRNKEHRDRVVKPLLPAFCSRIARTYSFVFKVFTASMP
jgi:predicted ATPase